MPAIKRKHKEIVNNNVCQHCFEIKSIFCERLNYCLQCYFTCIDCDTYLGFPGRCSNCQDDLYFFMTVDNLKPNKKKLFF